MLKLLENLRNFPLKFSLKICRLQEPLRYNGYTVIDEDGRNYINALIKESTRQLKELKEQAHELTEDQKVAKARIINAVEDTNVS